MPARPVNNAFSQASGMLAQTFQKIADMGGDFSQFRVAEVGPGSSVVRHAPSARAQVKGGPDGRVFDLAGTNYLGAAHWPELKEIGKKAIDQFGVGSFGTCPLSGETVHHDALKERLAKLYRPAGDGAAVLTVSASVANITALPMFVGHGDFLFFEEENHMTLVQGATLSRAQMNRYKHNDMADLEAKLKEADEQDPKRQKRRLIVTDGIFSMSGHVCNLPELSRLAKQYGSLLMLDESHALGAVGPHGHGTIEHWGADPSLVDIVSGTLGKSVGCMGGYIVASKKIAEEASLEYTTNRTFSSVMPGVLAACGAEVLRQMLEAPTTDNTYKRAYADERRNVQILKEHLLELRQHGFGVSVEENPAFVQRLVIGNPEQTFEIQKRLYDRGVYVLGYVYPVVHQGKDMLRLTPMASIPEADMRRIARDIVEVCKEVKK